MTRLILSLLTLGALVVPSLGAPPQRSTRRAAPRPQAAVSFDGDPARFIPADAILYVEVSNVAAVAEQLGGPDYLYTLLKSTFPKEFPATGKPLFTSEQFRGLLASRIALAALPRPGSAGADLSKSEPHVAVLVQTGAPEVAAFVESMMTEANRRVAKTAAKPRVQTLRGLRMTTTTTAAGKQLSHATAGSTLLFGDPQALTRLIGDNGKATFRPLATEPGFASAVQHAHASRQFFAYLNGKPFVKAFHEGLEQGAKGMTPKESKGAEIAALKRFLGLDSLLAGSVSAALEGDTLEVRGALELDRNVNGLLTVLSDPPAIALRANELFPIGTDVATAVSIDLVRIYDLVVATLTPELTKSLGFSLPEAIAAAERELGMKLRDDLLASIGNELAVGIRLVERPAVVAVQDAPAPPPAPMPDVEWLVAMEVRNPEVLSRAVDRFRQLTSAPPAQPTEEGGTVMEDAGAAAGVPIESHEGFPIYGTGDFRHSLLGDFYVFGSRAALVGAIDAKTKRTALVTDPGYGAAVGTVPDGTIWAMYASPRFFDWIAKSASSAAGGRAPDIAFPNGLFLSVQKDASGISSGFRIPVPNLKLLLEKERQKSISMR